jgi:multiple sugar transport system substrate-binding protein
VIQVWATQGLARAIEPRHQAKSVLEKEVAVDDLGDRSKDELLAKGKQSGTSRRDFLKKAAGVALAVPAAGALVDSAAAQPRMVISDRARSRWEGTTLQFAKAPFGNDEKNVIAGLLAPFEKSTGITVKHTIVPWNVEGATYATNYAGPSPFDVSYQTSTDLTGLGTKGVLEVLNTSKWLDAPAFASTKKKFITNTITKSTYKGKLYGLPCIIGGTVVYYNKDLLAKAGVTTIPSTMTQLAAAAMKVMKADSNNWGYQVPLTDKDFNWYFQYNALHNAGGDIISADSSKATFNTAANTSSLQAVVDLVLKYKVSPPVGQYDREAGVALFKAGRIAFLHDEPLRLPVFKSEKLPFKWDFVNPMGANGKRTIFSTTGHWVMAAKSPNQSAAWELVKFLSSPAFANGFGAHYGWAPVRSDVNTSKGDPQVMRINNYVLKSWDGLPTGPKMAQLTDTYGQAIEAAATGSKSVKAALAKAQSDGTAVIKS